MKPSDHRRGLTREILREILDYNQDSGDFIWRVNSGKAKRGNIAGKPHHSNGVPSGYILIGIKGYHYLAHRLAWFYVYGEWPPHETDHINLIKGDNRIRNLRKATKSQNMQNTAAQSGNISGYKGVTYDPRDGRYDARLTINGKTYYLGRFDTPEEANAAYMIAAKKLCGEFARAA